MTRQERAMIAFKAVKKRVDQTVEGMARDYISDQMLFDLALIALEAAFPVEMKTGEK